MTTGDFEPQPGQYGQPGPRQTWQYASLGPTANNPASTASQAVTGIPRQLAVSNPADWAYASLPA